MRPHSVGVAAGVRVHESHRRRAPFDALVALGFLCTILSGIAGAQTSPVRLSGGLNLGNELYSSSGIEARRPKSTYRAILTPTLTIYDQISLPFELYLTSDDRGFRQPFNQFGVNPRFWGWLTLHAGYYTARISDLTFGDARLLGGGVELTPGLFRFSFLYGRSQQAVQTDTTRNFRGVFERKVYAVKLGYGTANHFFVDFNFLHAEDDKGSIKNPVPGVSSDSVLSNFDVAPQENAVASLSYGIPILGSALQLTGETALSALSNDTRLPELTNTKFKLGSLFTPRVSSQIDGASQLSLNAVPAQTFSVRLTGKWVGPGYVSLGYAQLPNDVMEITMAPSYHTIDGAFSLRPSFGLQYNNLRNNRFSTTRRTITNISSTIQPSQSWGFDVLYTNYGMRSNPHNDTLRIDNIAQMVSLSPRYTFPSWDGTSTLTGSYTFQDFTDYNVVSASTSANRTQSGVISWTLGLQSRLTLSTTLVYTKAATSFTNTIVRSASETVSYPFLENHLTTSITGGLNSISIASTDKQFTGRLSASYNTMGWGVFTLSLSTNSYDFGNPASGSAYSEQQGSLQYSLGF